MAADCIFCKIASGQIPAEKVYEDDLALAFKDINPAAPHHVLIITREHVPTVNDITPAQEKLFGHLFLVAQEVAKKLGIAESGYRLVTSTNRDAGQLVFHVHTHLLGGRELGWPPG